jgi:hypothetical protein
MGGIVDVQNGVGDTPNDMITEAVVVVAALLVAGAVLGVASAHKIIRWRERRYWQRRGQGMR